MTKEEQLKFEITNMMEKLQEKVSEMVMPIEDSEPANFYEVQERVSKFYHDLIDLQMKKLSERVVRNWPEVIPSEVKDEVQKKLDAIDNQDTETDQGLN